MSKVPLNMLLDKHRILTSMNISGSCVILIVIVLCLSLPSVSLIVHLKIISKLNMLKAGSVSKVKVVSGLQIPFWLL